MNAQSGTDSLDRKIKISGYIKSLQSAYILNNSPLFTDQLIHNRINLKQEIIKNHTWNLEFRNRIFYGQLVQLSQSSGTKFLKTINTDENKWIRPSFGLESKKGIATLIQLDRAYWQWSPENWEIRIGRQRVNWGMATIWNPNDIFNAYGFTDFDYEERPAVDGIRIRRFIGYSGSIEAVASIGKNSSDLSFGSLYKTNIGTYDMQFLAGYTDHHYAIGVGTAGNLGLSGLKMETTIFVPENGGNVDLSSTVSIDYTFKNGVFISGGGLYNSQGKTEGDLSTLFNFQLSARNLYPYKWAILSSLGFDITALLNANLVAVYSPVQSNALFINPNLTYSIAEAWDINLIGQLAFNTASGKYTSPIKGFFLRLKYSF
ncbi:MAG: hypothetical protein ABI844_04160 [Saprospiraceae bacterium]